MILIDALHIKSSGGLVLLKRLISRLEEKGIDVFYLLDIKIEKLKIVERCENICYLKSSILYRFLFYVRRFNQFDSILCFGNIPPPIKMKSPVFVLFHNVLFFKDKIDSSIFGNIVFKLKKKIILKTKKNADKWVVQTNLVMQNLEQFLKISTDDIIVNPFYDIPSSLSAVNHRELNSFIYVSTDVKHKNHLRLLDAWSLLLKNNWNYTLHLTIPLQNIKLVSIINDLNNKGANIINHGIIDRSRALELYQNSEYLIHPSLEESFGLGLIEAFHMGCKIIAPNLPYVYEIIDPDITFNAEDVNSIALSLQHSIDYKSFKSKLKIQDNTDKLINTLC